MTVLFAAAVLLSSSPAVTCTTAPTRLVAVDAGVKLLDVPPGSFWDQLRLESGDVLLRINGKPVHKPELVCARLHEAERTEIDISRRGSAWQIVVRLGDDPAPHERVVQLCGGDSRIASVFHAGARAGVKLLAGAPGLTELGLQRGDVIWRVGGEPTRTPRALCYALAAADATSAEISRRGQSLTVTLRVP